MFEWFICFFFAEILPHTKFTFIMIYLTCLIIIDNCKNEIKKKKKYSEIDSTVRIIKSTKTIDLEHSSNCKWNNFDT